jgi:hypothetical protein
MRQLDELEQLVRMTKEQISSNCGKNSFNIQEQMKIDEEDDVVSLAEEENCYGNRLQQIHIGKFK